jgi:hypothetical protein
MLLISIGYMVFKLPSFGYYSQAVQKIIKKGTIKVPFLDYWIPAQRPE